MADDAPSLDDLRAEIDRLDTAMHDLLMERIALTDRVAAYKDTHAPDRGKMRPAREANILRKLVARHEGQLPVTVVARIWREIMAAVVHMQDPVEIQVAGAGRPVPYWDLARSHFGIQAHRLADSAAEVVAEARRNPGVVGVLPAPADVETDPWWLHLNRTGGDGAGAGPDAPKVFARLPFVEGGKAPGATAYAVGRVVMEESGDDLTWLVLKTREEVSRARIVDWLGKAGIDGHVLAGAGGSAAPPFDYLVEVAGSLMGDAALEPIKTAGGPVLTDIAHIGMFARPIRPEGG